MMAIRRKDNEAKEKFSTLKKGCLRYRGAIIESLEQYGEIEIADLINDDKLRDELTQKLSEYMKNNFEAISSVKFSSNGEDRYKQLQRYFTFMYR